MIQLKNEDEIGLIRESGDLLAETFRRLKELVEPGVETGELDAFCRDFILERGGKPSFLGYMNYPASLCVSINEEVIHGIPGRRKLKEGDIVSLDLGAEFKGFYSDAAQTYPVGKISDERKRLLRVTRDCLEFAVDAAKAGGRLRDISDAVYRHATENGYGVVRDFCGHGVGFAQHEDPQVPNYVGKGPNPRLKPGMVLAIEPMINMGTGAVTIADDDWTVLTEDGKDSAHFEYTVAVLNGKAEILTPIR